MEQLRRDSGKGEDRRLDRLLGELRMAHDAVDSGMARDASNREMSYLEADVTLADKPLLHVAGKIDTSCPGCGKWPQHWLSGKVIRARDGRWARWCDNCPAHLRKCGLCEVWFDPNHPRDGTAPRTYTTYHDDTPMWYERVRGIRSFMENVWLGEGDICPECGSVHWLSKSYDTRGGRGNKYAARVCPPLEVRLRRGESREAVRCGASPATVRDAREAIKTLREWEEGRSL